MAFMLNSSSGPEVAAELGDYLDKTLRTTAHLDQVKQEIKGGRFVSAVSLIIQESAHLWTSDAAADKDLEGFYALLTYFLLSPELVSNEETRDAVIFILTKETSRIHTRLAVLNHMYNSGNTASWKVAFFQAIVKLSIAAKQSNVLDSVLQDLDRLTHLWGVSAEEKAKLHYQLSLLLADSNPWVAHVHQTKWLESFKSEADCQSHVTELTQAFVAAIGRPDVFQYQTLISSPAAKVVSAANPELIKLATLLHNGSYQEYDAFTKSTKIFASFSALSVETIATKMRILTLVSLAQENTKIPYSTIAAALAVPADDVEAWVLDTISEGLIDAKLDHYSDSVYITYAFQRSFGTPQWVELRDKIGKWMENLKGMIAVIHDSRSHQGKAAQGEALKQALVGQ